MTCACCSEPMDRERLHAIDDAGRKICLPCLMAGSRPIERGYDGGWTGGISAGASIALHPGGSA